VGLRLALALCSIAAFSDPPLARGAEDTVDEIIVYGEQRPAIDVLTGSSITRIETDERLLEGAGIADLLSEAPGVQIRRYGGVGNQFEVSIRGSRPEQVPIFLNGFRLDTSLTGTSDLSALCLDVLQEIQVTRGPGAARSGSGAIGGVVNLVSRRPREDPETRVRLSAGNFDTYEGSLRHARRIGDWDLSFGYCGFDTEGDFEYQQIGAESNGFQTGASPILRRINNDAERHTGLAEIGRGVGKGRVQLTQLVTDLDRGSPGLAIIDTQTPFATERDLSTLSALAFDHPIEALPRGRIDLALSHRFERNRFENPEIQIATGDPIKTRTEVHGLVGSTSLRAQHEAFAGRHAWTLLAEGRFDRRESNEANVESRGSIAVRAELESLWWRDRISVTPSLRLERYSGLDLEWLPSLALQVEPLDWLVLRGAISRSYRAPSFQELYLPDKGFESGNPDLEPEEAWSYEIGAVLTSPSASPWLDFEIEAVYFAGEIDQSIAFQLVSPTRLSFVNTGRADTKGYELTLRWRPHDWVRMSASRTVTRARLDRTDCPIAGIAASQTDGRIEIGPRERFKLVGEIHYTGDIYLNSGCAALLPSRISYDASAAVDLAKLPLPLVARFAKSLWLSVRGRNLGNVAQYDTRSFPRPGRNFAVALEGVF
jgi:outer membrane cobalamin receptor